MAKLKGIFKKVLGTIAPMLGTAIGGPFGGMAGKILSDAFGGADQKDIETQIIAGDPVALGKLKEAELALEARMAELGIEETDLYLKDVQSARDMAKATSIVPQLILTFVAMFAFGAVLYVLVLKSAIIPVESKDIVIFLVGQLSMFTGMGFSFFLGSSKGSKEAKALAFAAQQNDVR